MTASLAGPLDHSVLFHAGDDNLVEQVYESALGALLRGDALLVVATGPQLDRLATELGRETSLDAHRAEGTYGEIDATATLDLVRRGGAVDRVAFLDEVGPRVMAAGAGDRAVRVVGSITGLLWEQHDLAGAFEVESAWNELATTTGALFTCAYPAWSEADELSALCDICSHHTSVDAYASYLVTGGRADERAAQLFLPVAGALSQVRRHVRHEFVRLGLEHLVDDASLIVSEIATNAAVHAGTPYRVEVERFDGAVRIAVTDGDPAMPVPRRPRADEPGGRGLVLVDSLSQSWGASATGGGGKTVWAQLAM